MEGGDPLDITFQTQGQWVTEPPGPPQGLLQGCQGDMQVQGCCTCFFKEKPEIPEICSVLATLCMCE